MMDKMTQCLKGTSILYEVVSEKIFRKVEEMFLPPTQNIFQKILIFTQIFKQY